MYHNEGVHNRTKWIGLTVVLSYFMWEMLLQVNQDWNVRYVMLHQCVFRCAMLAMYMFALRIP